MYSLIITAQAVSLEANPVHLTQQYRTTTETTLSHGEGYVIPSMVWPPPSLSLKFERPKNDSFMSSAFEVHS